MKSAPYIAFLLLIIAVIILISIYNRFSPTLKLQKFLLLMVQRRLSQRECIPLSVQSGGHWGEEELRLNEKIMRGIASALGINHEQLRLSERLLDALSINKQELLQEMHKNLKKNRRMQGRTIASSFAIGRVSEGLLELLKSESLKELGLKNEDEFEDFILFNTLETVSTRLQSLIRRI